MKKLLSFFLLFVSLPSYAYEIIRDPIFEDYFNSFKETNEDLNTVLLVDSNEPNAFVFGNKIYFTTELIKLIDIINPTNEEGRITLIARFGVDKIEDHLPSLIKAIESEGKSVVWCCDPVHGNTIKASNGYKTRYLDTLLSEVKKFIDIHLVILQLIWFLLTKFVLVFL